MIRIGLSDGAFTRLWCSANRVKERLEQQGDDPWRVAELGGWAQAELHVIANTVTTGDRGVALDIDEGQERRNRTNVAIYERSFLRARQTKDHLHLLNAAHGLIDQLTLALATSGFDDPGTGEGQKP